MKDSKLWDGSVPKIGPVEHLMASVDEVRMVVKNLQFEYIYANRCWLESNGLSSLDQIRGLTAEDLFPAWRAQRYRREEVKVIEEGKIYDYEELLLNSDGVMERWRTMKAPWIVDGEVMGYTNIGMRMDAKPLEQRRDSIPQLAQMLARNACNSQSLDELAEETGVSRRTMERRFRREMDMSPQQFRNKCRVLQAKKMLREGKKSSEVAELCGFADQSHFSKVFSRHLKQSPKQYQLEQGRRGK